MRDLSLVAYGAAGPMTAARPARPAPARERDRAAESRGVQRPRAAELRPGLHRDPHPIRRPRPRSRARALGALRGNSRRSCSSGPGVARRRGRPSCATFDGRLLGQGRETPFVAVPTGPLGATEIAQMIEAFHAGVRAAQRPPVRVVPGRGRQLPGAARGAVRQGALRGAADRDARAAPSNHGRPSTLVAPLPTSGRGRVVLRARRPPGRRPRRTARRWCGRPNSTTFVPRTGRRHGREVRRTGGDLMTSTDASPTSDVLAAASPRLRDLDDEQFRAALRLRPVHRDRAAEPVPLRGRTHGQPGACRTPSRR